MYIFADITARDHVEYHVNPSAALCFGNLLYKILFVIVNSQPGSELFAEPAFFRAAGRGIHRCAHGNCHLYADGAYAARPAVNKQGLALFQTATIKDVVPDSKRGFRQGGRIFHGKVVRRRQAQGCVGDRIFRITPAMDQRANPVARYRELKITIGFDDLSGKFKSGDFRCAGWRRVPAPGAALRQDD